MKGSKLSLLFLILALITSFFLREVSAQPKDDKLTVKEKKEAEEFAREFWAKWVKAKDIRPLLSEFAVKDFYKCLDIRSFAFMHEEQISPSRISKIKRYYIAETNFFHLLLLWGNGSIRGVDEDDPNSVFMLLPRQVKHVLTKETWEAINRNDSEASSEQKQSDEMANAYFDRVLLAFEKANPIFKNSVVRIGGGKTRSFKKAIKEYEENVSYAFVPESKVKDSPICGLPSNIRRTIIVDIPFFQLELANVNGRFRVVKFPFHVD